MYGSWDRAQQTEFFVILDYFLPYCLPNNRENQNFEKMKKKKPGDITILHMRTIDDNHMINGSLDMECNRQFFVILNHFCHFCPLTP